VDLSETPIECVTPTGLRTTEREYQLDVLIYATGFDAITGSFDRIDITGVDGRTLRDEWRENPVTYLGVQVAGFPNLIMLAGPQGASNSTNFPRAIESGVDWATELYRYVMEHGYTRVEVTPDAQAEWCEHVRELYQGLLLRKARSWFTGYNANVEGHDTPRNLIYNGGAPRYRKKLAEVAAEGYPGFVFS
jgi:cation diffusion facilitator CzcD-associated flavoprotein CzcO